MPSEQCGGVLADLGGGVPSLHGTCALERLTEAMLFRREPGGEGIVIGHPVKCRPTGSWPSGPLSSALRPSRERSRHLCAMGAHSGLEQQLAPGNNLKGSHMLLCSHWKHIYLFIMFEKSLQCRKEMFQSTEFYFHCRFIVIPLGFPQASCLLSVPSVSSQLFFRMTPSEPRL